MKASRRINSSYHIVPDLDETVIFKCKSLHLLPWFFTIIRSTTTTSFYLNAIAQNAHYLNVSQHSYRISRIFIFFLAFQNNLMKLLTIFNLHFNNCVWNCFMFGLNFGIFVNSPIRIQKLNEKYILLTVL